MCLKLLQVLVNEQALACKSVERSRVDLCDKSILHLAIDFVAEVVNEGFFIDIQLYSKALELSPKGSKGVLVLVQLSISLLLRHTPEVVEYHPCDHGIQGGHVMDNRITWISVQSCSP